MDLKKTILILLGLIIGSGLLSIVGCWLYWREEDKKLDRELEHYLAYLKNLRAEKWCSDAIDRVLDDASFWNDLSTIYLEADLLDESRRCYSMTCDILEGITGQSNRHPLLYIPRGSKHN